MSDDPFSDEAEQKRQETTRHGYFAREMLAITPVKYSEPGKLPFPIEQYQPHAGHLIDDYSHARFFNQLPRDAVIIPISDAMTEPYGQLMAPGPTLTNIAAYTLAMHLQVPLTSFSTGVAYVRKAGKPALYTSSGQAVLMGRETYRDMAMDTLHRLANPHEGAELIAFSNPHLYRQALKEEGSVTNRMVKNLLEQANPSLRELAALQGRANESDNFEFSAHLQRYREQHRNGPEQGLV